MSFQFGKSNLPAHVSHNNSYVEEWRDWIKCGERRDKLKFIRNYVENQEIAYRDSLSHRQTRIREILGEDTTNLNREQEILIEFMKKQQMEERKKKEEKIRKQAIDSAEEAEAQNREIMSIEKCPRYRISFM